MWWLEQWTELIDILPLTGDNWRQKVLPLSPSSFYHWLLCYTPWRVHNWLITSNQIMFFLDFKIKYTTFGIIYVCIDCGNRSIHWKVVFRSLFYTTLKLIQYTSTEEQDYFFICRERYTKTVEDLHSIHNDTAQIWKGQPNMGS